MISVLRFELSVHFIKNFKNRVAGEAVLYYFLNYSSLSALYFIYANIHQIYTKNSLFVFN
jgi:hypothetical protein